MTVVVKVGGAVGTDTGPVLDELARRSDCLLVHGGSEAADRLAERLGLEPTTFTSPSGVVSRRTDPARLEALVLALAGGVQTRLVAGLRARGVRAVGLSGVDGGLLRCRRKEGPRELRDGRVTRVRDDYSGSIESVDPSLLHMLLTERFVPVVGPPGATADGTVLNLDADRVASAVAVSLRADALVLLTNVPGLLRDPRDPSSVVREVDGPGFEAALALAHGRMRKKLLAAREAVDGGVPRAMIAPAAAPNPIANALEGAGTVFR